MCAYIMYTDGWIGGNSSGSGSREAVLRYIQYELRIWVTK